MEPDATLVWHYSTLDALMGMVETRKIWSTAAYDLNDTSEVMYALERLQEVRSKWFADMDAQRGVSTLEGALMAGLLRHLNVTSIPGGMIEGLRGGVSIVSASEKSDLLGLWIHYASVKGFAVGLARNAMLRPISRTGNAARLPQGGWHGVSYLPDSQRAAMREAVLVVESGETKKITKGMDAMARVLLTSKSAAFADEREVRFIQPYSSDAERIYTRRSGRIIAHVPLVSDESSDDGLAPLPIREVMCGPGVTERDRIHLNAFLQANGLNPAIFASTIPFDPRD